MVEHTVKAYDKELDSLGATIAEMGGVAQKMAVDALRSLAAADFLLAQEVITSDLDLNALQREVEAQAILTIARRAPVAVDLRDVVAAVRIAGDLGRIGDHAKTIAGRTVKVGSEARIPRAMLGLKHMNEFAVGLLKDAVDAYVARDAELARRVWERDAELDLLEGAVFRDLLSEMMADPRSISFCAHLMSVSKNIERIGDHSTNIAETVIYLVTGVPVTDERPRGEGAANIDDFVYEDD